MHEDELNHVALCSNDGFGEISQYRRYSGLDRPDPSYGDLLTVRRCGERSMVDGLRCVFVVLLVLALRS